MTLDEYRALSEEDRMKAAINSLAQVAMLPTVTSLPEPTGSPARQQNVNMLIERMTTMRAGKIIKVKEVFSKSTKAQRSTVKHGHDGIKKRPRKTRG